MDIVVYLALAVLAAVFLFSLFILVVMCRSRGYPFNRYNRLIMAQSLRFSKLKQDNFDDIIQLGPHISQKLNSNQWMEEVSGMLQNCVAVLKLCHILTENMAKIPLNQISPQLNEIICQATTRVVPRFDALLRSMAAKNVDIRVIEARMAALVTACWSLLIPFYLLNPQYKEHLGGIVREMEIHHSFLQFALEQADNELNAITISSQSNSTSSDGNDVAQNSTESSALPKQFTTSQNPIVLNNNNRNKTTRMATTNKDSPTIRSIQMEKITRESDKIITSNGLLRHHMDKKNCIEETKDLLNGFEAAPADPTSNS